MSTHPSQRLDGKVAIVTGATGGTGEATAALFLREGAKVMPVDRSAGKLAETADRLAAGDRVARFEADAGKAATAAPDNPDAVRDGLAAQVALPRYGTNEEVARLAPYLANGEASYTTGAVHAIDGGYTAA